MHPPAVLAPLLLLVAILSGAEGGAAQGEVLVFGLGSSDKKVAVARLAVQTAQAKSLAVPRGLRRLTILSCHTSEASTFDGQPLPVGLDPCVGLGVGTRLHFVGTPRIDSQGNQGGNLERAAYELVDRAIGEGEELNIPNERSGMPLHILETRSSRIAWTSEWDAAVAAFPKPILLDAARSSDTGGEDVEVSRNGWLYSRDAHMVGQMPVNNRGGRLQWSREVSYWLRENHLSAPAGASLDAQYRGCLTPVGASLHVAASQCRAGGGAGGKVSRTGAGDVSEDDEEDLCNVTFEYSRYLRAVQRCTPWFLAEKARRDGAPRIHVVLAKGLTSGTWITDDLDVKHSNPLAFSWDLQERAAGFGVRIAARTAAGSGFHRTLVTSWEPAPARHAEGGQGSGGDAGDGCQVLLLETLPHEVFVDPFELDESSRFGGNLSRVVSRQSVDLEVPSTSAYARQILVETQALAGDTVAGSDNLLLHTLLLPVHSRYQAPTVQGRSDARQDRSGYDRGWVHVPCPLIFTNCTPLGVTSASASRWRPVHTIYPTHETAREAARGAGDEDASGGVVWSVPVGREEDASLVRLVTVLVTLGGTLVCLYETLKVGPSRDREGCPQVVGKHNRSRLGSALEGICSDECGAVGKDDEKRVPRRREAVKDASVSGRKGRGRSPGSTRIGL